MNMVSLFSRLFSSIYVHTFEFLENSPYEYNSFSAQVNDPNGYFGGQYQNSPYGMDVLQYHLATNPLPHVSNLTNNQRSIHTFFMSDKLKEDLLRRNEVTLRVCLGKKMTTFYLVFYNLKKIILKSPEKCTIIILCFLWTSFGIVSLENFR